MARPTGRDTCSWLRITSGAADSRLPAFSNLMSREGKQIKRNNTKEEGKWITDRQVRKGKMKRNNMHLGKEKD